MVALLAIQGVSAQSTRPWQSNVPRNLLDLKASADQLSGELQAKQKAPPAIENAEEIRKEMEWTQTAMDSLDGDIQTAGSLKSYLVNASDYASDLEARYHRLKPQAASMDPKSTNGIPEFLNDFVDLANRIATHVLMQRSNMTQDPRYRKLENMRTNNIVGAWVKSYESRVPITVDPKDLDQTLSTIQAYMRDAGDVLQAIASLDRESKKQMEEYDAYLQRASGIKSDLLTYKGLLTALSEKSKRRTEIRLDLKWIIGLVGGMCLAAMLIVRWFPDGPRLIWIESGQMIQFVTVMIILSTILVLGLADVLKENTLGTLLGGIGGYVLSQGVGRAAARQAVQQMERRRERESDKDPSRL